MSWRLDRVTDRWVGHDHPGVISSGFGRFVLDELELGARAAYLIGEPDQWWWEIHAADVERNLDRGSSQR